MDWDINKFMIKEDIEACGVSKLNEDQKKALAQWGIQMYSLGQHRIANIKDVKFDGRLVILDDGSKWEVDNIDTYITSSWVIFDTVIVVEGKMYLLDELKMVNVEEFVD